MKHFFIITALIALLISTGRAFPQGDIARLEFDGELGAASFGVVPMADKGLAVLYETKEYLGTNRKGWVFRCFDTGLRETWQAVIPVVYGAEFQDFELVDGNLFLFFLNTGKIKEGIENFQLTEVNFTDSAFIHTTGTLPDNATFKEFFLAGHTAAVGLDLDGDQAAFYFIQPGTSILHELRFKAEGQSLVEDLRHDPHRNIACATVSHFIARRQNALVYLELDMHGNQLSQTVIDPVLPDKYLNTARTFAEPDGVKIMIGTYGNYSSRIRGDEAYSGIESAGLFITAIDSTEQKFMNYYNFLELKNLEANYTRRDFMRTQKRRAKDNSEFSLNYETLLHDIEKHEGKYILMAEAYYPEFRTVSDIHYDYWGRPVTQTYTVFEGYKYFSAVISAFDGLGNLLWDNNLDIADVVTFDRSKVAGYFFDGEPVLIYHIRQGKLAYKVCLEDVEIEGISFTGIGTSEAGDQVTETKNAILTHWYDHTFLCTGRQVIRNNLKAGSERRNVIFINKINLE